VLKEREDLRQSTVAVLVTVTVTQRDKGTRA
jgi:hypothetical protein